MTTRNTVNFTLAVAGFFRDSALMKACHVFVFTFVLALSLSRAESVFLEAETFATSSDGWKINQNPQTRAASLAEALNGASGDPEATATSPEIQISGDLRIWVRYGYHNRFRGPFEMSVSGGNRVLARGVFDLEAKPGHTDWSYVWDYIDVTTTDPFRIELAKHNNKNCTGYVRNVDCLLVTTDKESLPDHRVYGPQVWMRVTLGDIYKRPLHVHIFADHYRSPWYSHWNLSKAGANNGLRPEKKTDLLSAGDQTPWCSITRMLHEDSGAILNITARYTYGERADRLKAKIEVATDAADEDIIRTFDIDATPNGEIILMPAHLDTSEQRGWLKTAREVADATGKFADNFDWPMIGKFPSRIPVFAAFRPGGYGTPVDQSIEDREWKTLDYFGFSNREKYRLHGGIWRMKDKSFCQPDLEYMRTVAKTHAKEFHEAGKKIDNVAYCFLTDEPTGQPLAFVSTNNAYREKFRKWLRDRLGKTPGDLLVSSWEEVKPVANGDKHPAVYYYTQRYRTRALGDFIAVQRKIIQDAYQADFPTAVNFSDGAVYSANFYSQGVDYFELLDDKNQNAIWSEDWSNGASSYQCAAYNVDLMRAAARDRGQLLGHYLIAYAGRKAWDIKTKAVGETARGVRVWSSFSYGPSWGSHEGGPLWRNHAWYSKPEVWRANAEVVREIGAVEDMIYAAKADPAEVAILYSSSTDIWTVGRNNAYGFNRMHNWMAMAHAQIPVDIISERQVDRGQLEGRKVCYLTGPNLTRNAAQKLRQWVEKGGTLVLSAGAAERDEFNREMTIISEIIPAERSPVTTKQVFLNSGSYIDRLTKQDSVNQFMEVLSVQQHQDPAESAEVTATFSNGSAAMVKGKFGKGTIYSAGFLPSLDYIKNAVAARDRLQADYSKDNPTVPVGNHPAPPVELKEEREMPDADPRLLRSYNPWEFPANVREFILTPVRESEVTAPLTCDTPLIDAIVLRGEKGLVIPLANHTLVNQDEVNFTVQTGHHEIQKVVSVHQGNLEFTAKRNRSILFSLPLKASDYVMIHFE
ncbi:MAG: beta-galactosidase trimerization domain-containing protein [Verrucomicrobiales bacterium]|nr:beta-galactosidase trimerization domain-containing protein [Verrucomicrobiales bacterium]